MILYRLPTTEQGTFGILTDLGIPFAVTLERQWLGNAKRVSCIPDGYYTCKRIQSPKFGETFEITNVEGRSEILFHKGNIDDDSHGCVLVGEQFDPVFKNGILSGNGITSSTEGFNEFLSRLKGFPSFEIRISWIKGEI